MHAKRNCYKGNDDSVSRHCETQDTKRGGAEDLTIRISGPAEKKRRIRKKPRTMCSNGLWYANWHSLQPCEEEEEERALQRLTVQGFCALLACSY